MPKRRDTHAHWLAAQARRKGALEAAGIAVQMAELGKRSSYTGSDEAERERELVFAIPDLAVRKAVIQSDRDCMETMTAYDDTVTNELHEVVRDGGERSAQMLCGPPSSSWP